MKFGWWKGISKESGSRLAYGSMGQLLGTMQIEKSALRFLHLA